MGLFKRTQRTDHTEPSHDEVLAKDVVPRTRLRVIGTVLRMKTKPAAGLPTLVVTIGDDDGRVQAHWSGRRSIPGVTLGARIIIEGVGTPTPDGVMFLNPLYEIVSQH